MIVNFEKEEKNFTLFKVLLPHGGAAVLAAPILYCQHGFILVSPFTCPTAAFIAPFKEMFHRDYLIYIYS